MKSNKRYELGAALLTGGLLAASPVDEMACVATGPLAPVCAALSFTVSTPIGIGAAVVGLLLMVTS